MKEIFIRPAKPGAIVRFPNQLTRVLPAEGEKVADISYWQRRIRGGDVIEGKKKQINNGGKE